MNLGSPFIKRHQLIIFVLLAYLFSWWPALMPVGGLLPHGPMFAALLIIWLSEGGAGVRSWWARVTTFRTAWPWYVIGALIPTLIALSAAGLNMFFGAQITGPVDWMIPLTVLPIMLLWSGMWEEPGWTGYALPYLDEHFGSAPNGILVATAIMALIRSLWHLPLVISGSIYWTDLVFILAFQLVLSWLYHGSGSVPVVMLTHLMSNIIGGELVGTWFEGADWAREAWLRGLLWILFALVLLAARGVRLGKKPQPIGS